MPSYAELCRPPNQDAYMTRRCNIITGKCKKTLRASAWAGAERRYNKCLRQSEWGRARFDFSLGQTCWTKKKGKDKGKEFCTSLGTGAAAQQPAFNLNTSGSTAGSTTSQKGIFDDAASNFRVSQQHLIIGGAVLALLVLR